MAKVDFKRVLAASKVALRQHSPEVLTGIGIAGFIATVVLAVRATPIAMDNIEERKDELDYGSHERLPVKEVVRSCWKCYTPAVLLAAASTGCVIGGLSTSLRRTAAMTTVATMAEATLEEYSKKVVEEIGEEKEKEIKKDAKQKASERVSRIDAGRGTDARLYVDGYLGRIFYATPVEIETAIGKLNHTRDLYDYFTMNDFYSAIPRAETCPAGDEFGWELKRDGYQPTWTEAYVSDTTIIFDGKPALVIKFSEEPGPLRRRS